MAGYSLPTMTRTPKLKRKQVQLVAGGGLRPSANQACWTAQAAMEQALGKAIAAEGHEVVRAQPSMYFRLGGGTLKGVSRPGEIVWSRIYIEDGKLKMDLGRGGVVELPPEETQRRWNATTPQWPIMHAVTYGTSRDQMMARHKADHVQIACANSADKADRAMLAKAALTAELGLEVAICGTKKNGRGWD